jgi:histone-lysine N-methyltransferase SETMAR
MGASVPNPNQTVLQGNGNIPIHLQQKSLRLLIYHQTISWDGQGVLLPHFQKHGENVNSASYSEVLLKLQDAIRRKHPGQLVRGVLLHHDSATPHTARATQELQWELLEHPPYSPGLVPSDFCLFSPL